MTCWCVDPVTLQLLEVGATIRENYLNQSKKCPVDFLYRALDICSATDISYKNSNNQRLHVELALMKMCRITGNIELPRKSSGKATLEEKRVSAEKAVDELVSSGNDQINEESSTEEEDEQDEEESTEMSSLDDSSTIPESEETGQELISQDHEPEPYKPAITSIKNALNGLHKTEDGGGDNMHESPVPSSKTINKNPFNTDTLISKWQTFADSIKSEKPRLSSSLKTQLPVLGDHFMIEVEMDNLAQKEDFDRAIKADLLEYLRKELLNDTIEISAYVVEEENSKNSLYTDDEKFNHLNQINPNLGKFKQQFNLDFE